MHYPVQSQSPFRPECSVEKQRIFPTSELFRTNRIAPAEAIVAAEVAKLPIRYRRKRHAVLKELCHKFIRTAICRASIASSPLVRYQAYSLEGDRWPQTCKSQLFVHIQAFVPHTEMKTFKDVMEGLKVIGAGTTTIALAGAAVGIGKIFSFALTEAIALFTLMMAFLILFLSEEVRALRKRRERKLDRVSLLCWLMPNHLQEGKEVNFITFSIISSSSGRIETIKIQVGIRLSTCLSTSEHSVQVLRVLSLPTSRHHLAGSCRWRAIPVRDREQDSKRAYLCSLLLHQARKFKDNCSRPDHDISLMIWPGRPNHDIEGWDLFSKKKGDSISSSKPFLEDAVNYIAHAKSCDACQTYAGIQHKPASDIVAMAQPSPPSALGRSRVETDIREKDEKASKNGQNQARNGKASSKPFIHSDPSTGTKSLHLSLFATNNWASLHPQHAKDMSFQNLAAKSVQLRVSNWASLHHKMQKIEVSNLAVSPFRKNCFSAVSYFFGKALMNYAIPDTYANSFGKEFNQKARFESLCSIKGKREAQIENSTTASKIAIQAKKEGGTSKHKNQSRAGSKSLDSKQARRNPSKALRQGLSR
ncbi:putative ATP synthase, F0 complex, subunit C [Tanacetum coccineum]